MFSQLSQVIAEKNSLRLQFLDNCCKADIIPRFLKFRIPNNGCFDDKSVNEFQLHLLRKELIKAKHETQESKHRLTAARDYLKQSIPLKLLPSVILHTRIEMRKYNETQTNQLNEKLRDYPRNKINLY